MRTKTTTKINHTQGIRDKYESNRQWILKETGISESELFLMKTEIGCQLLEEIYPRGGEYERHYQIHSKLEEYWNWFRLIWAKWDQCYIVYKKGMIITAHDYKSDMQQIVLDEQVHIHYSITYLKTLYNGIQI
jgi:hypothetical protein